ncbi:hypothetical protein HCUR_01467 [Holospora curviuscula]|uniref:Protein kinase domain-containing protein n=1 Tax=Holospora curviuscula TaxID=1082868 RepID=A0A2S5R6S8_9PROT|nr:hypothetical protein HCUR_01467 [Holospora curviuscula]
MPISLLCTPDSWRILPSSPGNINYWDDIEKYCQHWENSAVIRQRIENLNKASAHIALFLEYVPQNFDAHFKNILTDAKRIYLIDFGLALSSRFDLSEKEKEFLKQHQSYDQACAAVNLLHCIITSLFGKEHWEIRLHKYLAGELSNVPPAINTIINRYAPIALLMDEFFQKLQKESKSTPYPATQLEKLLRAISSETT